MDALHVNLHVKDNDLKTALPILLTLVFFVVYWFTAQSEKIKSSFFAKHDADTASSKHIFFTKWFGFVAMGIVPLLISLYFLERTDLAYFGLTFIPETATFSIIWTLGLCALVVPIASFSARKPKNLINYPQVRTKEWTKKVLFINALGWAMYLFGYELLFRGTLLFPLVDTLGVWPAIAINVALYSATHIPKGLDETIGAAPLGLVLCLLTLYSGTIWIAFLVHVAMAWTNEFTALKYHPDIHYVGGQKKK